MKRQPAKCFKDLIEWQKAHQFILSVYCYTAAFPKAEIYGLTPQFWKVLVLLSNSDSRILKMSHRVRCSLHPSK